MPSLVYLTNRVPSQIASDLTLAGYTVWEALAVSEVLYLREHQNVDVVVIGSEVKDAASSRCRCAGSLCGGPLGSLIGSKANGTRVRR